MGAISPAANAVQSYISPIMFTLCGIATLACAFFLTVGGIHLMSSRGNPDKHEEAKKVIRNALIGLVIVIAAGTLTAILSNAYGSNAGSGAEQLPAIQAIEQKDNGTSLFDVVTKTIIAVLKNIVQSVGEPFVSALGFFTNSTPLMGSNPTVYKLWFTIVGLANVLLILVIALLGFQKMSATVLGFEEVSLKQLLPQMAFTFLLMNTSIFVIDAIIGLSNFMIRFVQSQFESVQIWDLLGSITTKSDDLGLAGLLIMIAFLIIAVMLLVYYVMRLVALYIGAVLSPLIALAWLVPAMRDFAYAALRTYCVAIFVLFVHVIILILAASMFIGINEGDSISQANVLIALIVGIAVVISLRQAQGVMNQIFSAASAPKAARDLTTTFMRGMASITHAAHLAKGNAISAVAIGSKTVNHVTKSSGLATKNSSPLSNTSVNPPTKPGVSDKPKNTGETVKAHKVEKK